MKCNPVNLSSLLQICRLKLKHLFDCFRSCYTTKESEVDRISALPEPILQHILSFLPFKEAAHASLLSKKWKEAWDTLPVLSFDESVFTLDLWDPNPEQSDDKPSGVRRRKKKLFERLEKILEKRRKDLISTDKLSIHVEVSNQKEFLSFVDRCTCYAIDSNVKELIFEFGTWVRIWYNVPGNIFQAHSIVILKLSGCKLELLRSNVKLNSLRKLCLEYVYAENYAVENLLGGCPSIEELVLSSCRGFKILELFNVGKLNTIKLGFSSQLEQVQINALNVHFIELSDISVQCEFNLTACKNLKSLKLYYLLLSDEWLYNQVSELPALEYLNITRCIKLQAIFISSLRLKRLSICRCTKLTEIKIEAPNLTSFKYGGEMISFSSSTPENILVTDLCLDSQKMGTQWFAKYIELLAKFNRPSTAMNLQSEIGEDMIIKRELRQTLPPPLSNIKHLNYTINDKIIRYAIAEVLDGLLWISPHAETISIHLGSHKFIFQFSYKKQPIYEGEIVCCCKTLPISCWQRCINQVKIEYTNGNKVQLCFTVKKDFMKKIETFAH